MSVKRIVIYSLLGIVVIIIGSVAYMLLTTKSHSPANTAIFSNKDLTMSIDYCQPYMKGRTIFGEEGSDALIKYGKYWRTGANEATEIEINNDIKIENNTLKAGRYRLYTIPGKDNWTIAFNTETGKWGAMEPDYGMDLFRVTAASNTIDQVFEQFTIQIVEVEDRGAIKFMWDQTEVTLPFSY